MRPTFCAPPSMPLTRRDMLRSAACGFGSLALSGLTGSTVRASRVTPNRLAPREARFTPRAKRVIFLFLHGGVSQVDTFDPKPELTKNHGKPLPASFRRPGLPIGQNIHVNEELLLMRSPWEFRKYGQSGIDVSELFPHIAQHVDDLCVMRSLSHDQVNHGQALPIIHTGEGTLIRPSMGSWILYGLGSENENLPGFITICPAAMHGGGHNYGSAFLPGDYQGMPLGKTSGRGRSDDAQRVKFRNLQNSHTSRRLQRLQLDLIQSRNRQHLESSGTHPDLEARIQSLELAFRMQAAAPGLTDLSGETSATLEMYGVGRDPTDNFGRQCLLARRLAESGVRFVQATHSYKWDQHGSLKPLHEQNAHEVDQPIAALLKDLKQRGLLDDTLVFCGTEFGRTPVSEGSDGRDHNPYGFTVWLAGGGLRGGIQYGTTDDIGFFAAENVLSIHDIHATMLYLLGLDHTRLTYRYSGRDFRLTDVDGKVVHDIIA